MEILETIENSNDADWQPREVYWINWCRKEGFDLTNLREGGVGGARHSEETINKHRARIFTDEHRKKISDALKGRKPSTKCMEASKRAHLGKKQPADSIRKRVSSLRATLSLHPRTVSDETRAKISLALSGRKASDEAKQRQRDVWNRPGYRDKMVSIHTGRKASPEARENISKALKGRKHSETWKSKMSEIMTGRIITPEWRENMSKAAKGRNHSEETKKKMAIAQLARRQKYLEEHGVPEPMPRKKKKSPCAS